MPAETDAAMLDRLTGLAEKATPGPWNASTCRTEPLSHGHVSARIPPDKLARSLIIATGFIDDYWSDKWGPRPDLQRGEQNADNADFIAACDPGTIRRLISLARRGLEVEQYTPPTCEVCGNELGTLFCDEHRDADI